MANVYGDMAGHTGPYWRRQTGTTLPGEQTGPELHQMNALRFALGLAMLGGAPKRRTRPAAPRPIMGNPPRQPSPHPVLGVVPRPELPPARTPKAAPVTRDALQQLIAHQRRAVSVPQRAAAPTPAYGKGFQAY